MPGLLYKIVLFIVPGLCPISSMGQEEKVYTVSEVSIKPEPVSGLKDFQERWSKKVRYPKAALKQNIQGVVFIEFVVRPDSTVTDAAIKAGIGHGCDEAALEGFEELSKGGWKPGVKSGQPVNVKMVLPFYFRIVQSGQK